MELIQKIIDFAKELIPLIPIVLIYKFACKHSNYTIEFGLFKFPKKITGELNNNDKKQNIC